MKKTIAIYARVSTDRQTVDMQLHELREYVGRGWNLYREFVDQGFSGSNTKMPAFQEMMNEAKKRKFDVLLVWKLDRLSRSMKDLVMVLNELGGLGIDFVSYDNNLDTSTPTGSSCSTSSGPWRSLKRTLSRKSKTPPDHPKNYRVECPKIVF